MPEDILALQMDDGVTIARKAPHEAARISQALGPRELVALQLESIHVLAVHTSPSIGEPERGENRLTENLIVAVDVGVAVQERSQERGTRSALPEDHESAGWAVTRSPHDPLVADA